MMMTTIHTIWLCNDEYFISFGVSHESHKLEIFSMPDNVLYQLDTNMTTDIADTYMNEIIDKLAEICIKYNLSYQSFHNHLFGMNGVKSKELENKINNIIALKA